MNKPKLTNREKVMIFAILALVLIGGYLRLILMPVMDSREAAIARAQQMEKLLSGYHNLLERKDVILDEYQIFKKSDIHVDPYASIIEMTEDLQNISAGLVVFQSVRPLEALRTKSLNEDLAIEVNFRADLKDIIHLLYKIEKEGGRLNVSRLNMSILSGDSAKINTTMLIKGKAQ